MVNHDDDGGKKRRAGPLARACLRVPGWAFLPLTAVLTVAALLVVMLPVYYATCNADNRQNEPKVFPADMTVAELDNLVQTQINLELEVLDISPEEHEVSVVFVVHPGGNYSAWDDTGLMLLPDGAGSMLVITVGEEMAVKISHADVTNDISLTYIMDPVTRLFYYPFDEYEIILQLEVAYLDPNATATALPVGVVYAGGRQGWALSETMGPLYHDAPNMGVTVVVRMERSVAVKLSAVLIVIFMWCISLAIFSLSINVILSHDDEPSYDVSAISVGLLFALPFVRSVMPDVPDVGIACDVLGFFWNIILVALSTIITIGTIIRTHRHRAAAAAASLPHPGAPPHGVHPLPASAACFASLQAVEFVGGSRSSRSSRAMSASGGASPPRLGSVTGSRGSGSAKARHHHAAEATAGPQVLGQA